MKTSMRTRWLFLSAGVFFASAALGVTEMQWKGVGLGNYMIPENWSLGTVPGTDSSVVIGVNGEAVLSGESTSTYLTLGGNGALTVGPGGSLTLMDSFWIGNKDGGESVLTIDGGTVVFGHFFAGNGGPSRIILKDGTLQRQYFADFQDVCMTQCMLGYAWNGTSTLEIRGGTFNMSGTKAGDSLYVGRDANGFVCQTGGRYLCGNYLALGLKSGFKGIYDLYDGEVAFSGRSLLEGCSIGSGGYGEFNIYGGTVTAANGRFQLSDTSTAFGKLRLCGGRLQIYPFTKDNGATTRDNMFILWNGGTFALPPGTVEYAASDYFANVQNMYMGPDGLTLDTAGNTFTVDAPIADLGGPGRLEKVGEGTLVLGTRNGFAGGVQVTEGTVRLGDEPAPSPRGPATNTLPVTARTRVNARDYLLHRWSFNGDYVDSVGGQTAVPSATGVHLEDGAAVLEQGTSNSQNRFVALGSNAIPTDGSPSTIEMWVREDARTGWSMLFSLSSQTKSSAPTGAFYMTFDHAGSIGTDNVTCLGTAGASLLATASNLGAYTLDEYYLVAVSFEPLTDGSTRIRWRRFDTHAGTILGCGETVLQDWTPARLDLEAFNLGWCCVPGINSAYAHYDEVRVWNAVLNDDQLVMDARLGPDVLPQITRDPAAFSLSPLSVAAGAVFDLGTTGVALADFSGAGTVDGTGTLTVTNSFTPEAGLALDAPVVVSGEWVVNIGEDGTCPVITGTGSMSLDNVTVRVVGADRLDDSVRDLLLARMPAGGATGSAKQVTGFSSERYVLRTSADGSIHLSRPGMVVMIR